MGALRDVIAAGLAADRPAAGHAGRVYFATDTRAISRDNGATWDTMGATVSNQAFVYAPAGWDALWQAARRASSASPAWIAAVGDSVTQGINAADYLQGGWLGRLRASLLDAGAHGLFADFYPVVDSQAYMDVVSLTWGGTPPWTVNTPAGSTLAFSYDGYVRDAIWTGSVTVDNLASFVSPDPCTALDILYLDYTAGTWQYAVDGADPVTVTTTGMGDVPNSQVKRISVTGLASGVHTVTFGHASTDAALVLLGVSTYTGANGLGFVRAGWASGAMSYQADSSGIPADKIRLWQGALPQGDAAATLATGFGFPTQPHLLILAMALNDCGNGADVGAFQQGAVRYIQAMRRGQPGCSILFLLPALPDGVNSDLTDDPLGNKDQYWRYVDALLSVARTYNCAVVNIHAKWGETPQGQGFMVSGDPHPTDAGYADMAALVAEILSPI